MLGLYDTRRSSSHKLRALASLSLGAPARLCLRPLTTLDVLPKVFRVLFRTYSHIVPFIFTLIQFSFLI